MKFLFASESFKGSLSSQKTAELVAKAAREIFPDCLSFQKRKEIHAILHLMELEK